MRKYRALFAALAFLLGMLGAMAQTSSRTPASTQTTTTTTTTTTQSTTIGKETTTEGCVVREASDFFLIPRMGSPIHLQSSAGQDLSAQEGHHVRIRGIGSSSSAGSSTEATTTGIGGTAGAAATASTGNNPNAPTSSGAIGSQTGGAASSGGTASGTGNDLHSLSKRQMTVAKIDMVAETCPVNWNPGVPRRSTGTSNPR